MVTVKQIAEAAGCSPSTVSIVLGGKAAERNISEATCRRVLEAAAKLKYQPNIAARSLRNGMGSDELQIALFWAEDFRASMMVRFWDGLRQALEKQNRNIRLVIIPYTNGRLCEAHAITSKSDCHAAIICNASDVDLRFLEQTQLPVPVVLYNRICPGYSSVNVDDRAMGALAMSAMAGQGCRRMCALAGESVFAGIDIRIQGFADEGERRGLEHLEVYRGDNGIHGGYQLVKDLIDGVWARELPHGVFCSSSMLAHGAIRAFTDAGLKPEEMPRIVAVGNGMDDQDKYSIPSLSVVYLPMEDMARECLTLILETLSGTSEPRSVMLDTPYIARESCGPIV